MFSKRDVRIKFSDLAQKIENLSPEKKYLIQTSRQKITVGKTALNYYLIAAAGLRNFDHWDKFMSELKKVLDISSDDMNVSYCSVIQPKLFAGLDPKIQALFRNKSDLQDPLKVLITAAGFENTQGVSHAKLITALKTKGMNISATDIAKIIAYSQLSPKIAESPRP